MPELPEAKREPLAPLPARAPRELRYAELHCLTNFSFLEGASHPDELVNRAAELGYAAIAVTDRNSLAGVVRAHVAAKESCLKLLVGAEIAPHDAPPVVVWAIDRAGYGRLVRLLTVGRRAAPKGECHLSLADVAEHATGLLAGVPLLNASTADLCRYRDIFADRCYALAELHRGLDDRGRLHRFLQTAHDARVPLAAANDVHYHVPARRILQDVLTAIRHGCTVAELGERRFANAERHLRSLNDLYGLFAEAPEALVHTVEIAHRCCFSLDQLRYEYPEELCPAGTTPLEHLTQLTWEGACNRYPLGVPEKVCHLIRHELVLIAELHYEAYFLTVWDLVLFARSRGILCQGRGSAANSAVCFCLGVTSVDPERIDVLFERFISKERNEAPDIDIDFEHERREEVLQYVYAKYGRERAGMTAEVITYQARSAVRDVGKALGLSLDRIDVLAKAVDHHHDEERLRERFRGVGQTCDSFVGKMLVELVGELVHFPRHLSQHVGGMVITQGPLCELVPIENASMPGRTVVEWDKNDLDALGILKVDCLALGMLTAIRKGFDLIRQHYKRELTLATVPAEDPGVYDMVCRADTVGVFQIESRAQMSMLPRLKPRCFYDLVVEVAIVRPGPIQGNMVHPYLRRRRGEEPVDYPDERIRAVLEKTLGVPIFQEQAMRLAVVAAGFTPGEADQLRRAMGAWRRRGVMEKFHQKLVAGMRTNGYSAEFAERVFKQICGFGEYGFPESHAASFALLVYVSAWLKRYYPEVFAAALLNSQPMGFYAPAQIIADARRHGVVVRPVDINFSSQDCTLEPADGQRCAIRLGFRLVGGMQSRVGETVVSKRESGLYVSFGDFVKRTGLRKSPLQKLAQADGFGSLGLSRREALWRILPDAEPMPLFDSVVAEEVDVDLPKMAPLNEVLTDYVSTGLSLRQHPISFLRQAMDERGITPAHGLETYPNGREVTVAGLVLMRQRPSTAKGITFVTLEDETGVVNLIVRQNVWEQHRRAARAAVIMVAAGQLQREGSIIHVLVERIEDWSGRLAELDTRSRDFR
jgi:error-prone DNA polymerase